MKLCPRPSNNIILLSPEVLFNNYPGTWGTKYGGVHGLHSRRTCWQGTSIIYEYLILLLLVAYTMVCVCTSKSSSNNSTIMLIINNCFGSTYNLMFLTKPVHWKCFVVWVWVTTRSNEVRREIIGSFFYSPRNVVVLLAYQNSFCISSLE